MQENNLNEPVSQHLRRVEAKLQASHTVGEALEALREEPPAGKILYWYVIDEEGKLVGVMPTRALLIHPLEKPIAELMITKVITMPETATIRQACEYFQKHELLAFPVVDSQGKLLGSVDVEMYTDKLPNMIDAQQRSDVFQLIGVHLSAGKATPMKSFGLRFPWLLCNVAGGLLAAFISGLFTVELEKLVALSLFIPVVLALCESVAIQSVTLALQAMHGQPPTWWALFLKLFRELQTGFLLGALSAVLVTIVVFFSMWEEEKLFDLLTCILGGIGGGVTLAAGIGILIPNLLRLLHFDPKVAAGPIALASADVVTLCLYFGIARIVLAS